MSVVYSIAALWLSIFSIIEAYKYNISLEEILQGECRVVAPRVCKKITTERSPDYTCGFIFRDVCSGYYQHHRTKRSDTPEPQQTGQNSKLHVTPIPSNMKFYDGNHDGILTLNEFARTLGHNPRARHVRQAFRAVDRNGNGKIEKREFKNNVWIFDDGFTDKDYKLIDAPTGATPPDTTFDKDVVPPGDSEEEMGEYKFYEDPEDDSDGGSDGNAGGTGSGSGDSSSSSEDSSGDGGSGSSDSDSDSDNDGDSDSSSKSGSGSDSGSAGGDSGSESGDDSGGDSGGDGSDSGGGGGGSDSGGDNSGSSGEGGGMDPTSSDETPTGIDGVGGMPDSPDDMPGTGPGNDTDDSTENYPDYPATQKPMLDIPQELGVNKNDDESGNNQNMMDMAFIQSALDAMKQSRMERKPMPRGNNMQAAPRVVTEPNYQDNMLFNGMNNRKEYPKMNRNMGNRNAPYPNRQPVTPPNMMGNMMGVTPPYRMMNSNGGQNQQMPVRGRRPNIRGRRPAARQGSETDPIYKLTTVRERDPASIGVDDGSPDNINIPRSRLRRHKQQQGNGPNSKRFYLVLPEGIRSFPVKK